MRWTTCLLLIAVFSILLAFPGRNAATRPDSRFKLTAEIAQALERKREKARKKLKPYDQPAEAAQFHVFKRSPDGKSPLPVERYLEAMEFIKSMPRYTSETGAITLSQNELGLSAPDLPTLGTWSSLGPGNIGGRTRALLIHPTDPSIMYAAGVSGGVWKTTSGGASWTPLADMMANLAISTMAMDQSNPNIVYAGTGESFGEGFNSTMGGSGPRGAGVFKTTDGGANWTQLAGTNNSNFYYVNDIVISPTNSQRLYAATETGVYRSFDGGANWTQVHNQPRCGDLAIRTDQPTDYIFASCRPSGQGTIYRHTNAGGAGTWDSIYTEAGMGRTSLALAPSNQSVIYAMAASTVAGPGGNYAGGLHAVFRSTNSGDAGTWTAQVRNSSPAILNTLLLTNPVYAFSVCVGAQNAGFFNQGFYDNVIAVDPLDSNRVWAGGIDLFRSDDGGANWGVTSYWWESTADPGYAHADQHAIVFHPQYNGTTNKIMFVGNDGGVFRTNDARAAMSTSVPPCTSTASVTWTALNNNYGVTQFYHGVPYPSGTTYFGGTQDNGTVRGNDGSGANAWGTILGGDGGYVAVDPGNTNILYAENFSLSIQKSINGGNSFFNAITGITEDPSNFLFINPFIMDPTNSQRLWTGGNFMWRTSNGATSWTRASNQVAFVGDEGERVSAIAIAPTNANFVLSGTSTGYINRTNIGLTSDGNTLWPFIRPRVGFVSGLTFDPTNANIAYATYSTFGGTHVWRSTDAGASWTGIDGSGVTAIPDIPVHCIVVDPSNTQRLYVGTDLGVFASVNGGASWMVENTGFANVTTESLSLNSVGGTPSLYAFTHGRGAWRVPLSGGGCTLTCPSNITTNTAPNQCSTIVTYPPPATSGTCGTVTCTPASGATFQKGTTTVNCTSSAGGGSCSFTVTVNDNQSPTITCPANVSVTSSTPTPVSYSAPTVSDNCPGAGAANCVPASGSTFPVGTTTVNCSVSDASGNPANCSFTVTVSSGTSGAWTAQPSGTANNLWSVHFVNDNEGWAAGNAATLRRTTNGGTNWTTVNTGLPTSVSLFSVRFLDQNTGWAGGGVGLARTANGGASWNSTILDTNNSREAFFPVSASTVWSVGTRVDPPTQTNCTFLSRIAFNGSVFTENGFAACPGPNLLDVYFVNADTGWSIGASGLIYRITNAGAPSPTFTPQTSGTTQALWGMHMLDLNTGWIAGNAGTILKTVNGGTTWTPQTSGTTADLRDAHFINANEGWVVGLNGLILRTTNGGATWSPETSGVTAGLNSVFFPSAGAGYSVGASGTILKRASGGGGVTGLQYYPLPRPIRLFDTRAPIPGFAACAYLNQPLLANQELARPAAGVTCDGITIPANAQAIVGNATVTGAAGNGFITLFPDGQPRPPVSNLNHATGQTVPNAFTVGLGANGMFRTYSFAGTHFIVDVTGYFAPPGAGGLFYHPLPRPIRLFDTRAPIPGFPACEYLNQPLVAGAELARQARITCDGLSIPADAQAIVGNATVVGPSGAGFATLWPNGQPRPPVSNLNYTAGQVVPNAFTVGLGSDGQFRVYSLAGTHFIVDITGYYSPSPSDANGAGLLYSPLPRPIRLFDTRAPIPGFPACEYLNQPLVANAELAKQARITCDGITIPAAAQAIAGNATVVGAFGSGFVTLWPNGQPRPPVSNLNYVTGQTVPNAFTVGLGADGQFRIYSLAGTHFITDVAGFFAP